MSIPTRKAVQQQMAAHIKWSRVDDPTAHTAPARANSPAGLAYHERLIDPDGQLDPIARRRRAEHARKAYFLRLAMRSAQARRARRSS